MLHYGYLSQLHLLTHTQIFMGNQICFFVWIFVKTLIDVNQTARKRESVLKDLDIINRRLHNIQMNSSLLKRFWFSDVFHLWHHIAIYHNLTFHCWIMRSAIKQIIMCDAKWHCLHSDAKTLKWTLIAMKRIKHHSQT